MDAGQTKIMRIWFLEKLWGIVTRIKVFFEIVQMWLADRILRKL